MASRTLSVAITGDPSSLNRALRSVDQSVEGSEKRMHKFAAVGIGALKGLGLAAGAGAVVGLKKSADAAIEAEKSQARLVTQLKAAGISYKAHAQEIDRVIQKTSQLSGLDDEDLQDSFTNIVRVTGDVNKSLRLTGLAADFARAKHMDVAKAGEVVAKVAGGNTGILSRYGIQIDKGASSTEALGKLQAKFAGQAEAYGKTTQGSLDRASVASENLGEIVGAKLTPLLAKAASALVSLINAASRGRGPLGALTKAIGAVVERVSDAVGWFRRHRTAATALLTVVAGLTTAWATYRIGVLAVAAATKVMAAAQLALNLIMDANPVGLVVTAIAALTAGLVVAYKRSATFRKIVDGAFSAVKTGAVTAAHAIKTVVVPVFNAIKTAAEKLSRAVGGVGRAFGAVKGALGSAADFVNPFGDGVGKALAPTSIPGIGGKGGLMGADPDLQPFANIGSRFGLGVSSGLRPGAITVSGNKSYHGSGDAIDMAGSPSGMMAFFKYMRKNLGGRLRELIYTPGGAGIKDGKPYVYTGAVAADHFDHVHVAYTGPFGDGVGQIKNLWTKAGGSKDAANMAAAVAMAESGGNASAKNVNTDGSIDRGLWQINSVHGSLSTFNRLANARAAVSISHNGADWSPWVTYQTGAYRRFLSGGGASGARGGGGSSAATHAAKAHKQAQAHRQSVRQSRQKALGAEKAATVGTPQDIFDTESARGDIAEAQGNMAAATFIRVVSLRKQLGKVNSALRKKGLKPKRRAELLAQKAQILQGITSAQDAYAGSLPDAGTGADDGSQAIADAIAQAAQEQADRDEAMRQAIEDQTKAMQEVRDAAKADTELRAKIFGTQTGVVMAAIADMVSGQIGGQVGLGTQTPSFAGSAGLVRY
jgi:hypothetical protein